MNKIIEIIEKDCRVTAENIAVMLDRNAKDVKADIKKLEDNNVILGYKALVNHEKIDSDEVTAFIELRVTPQRGEGFDKIAERIYQYEKVQTVWLMSGGFDIGLVIKGKGMKEVALFVAEKLAPMDCVVSTKTHFVLKTYKEMGVPFAKTKSDERGIITL